MDLYGKTINTTLIKTSNQRLPEVKTKNSTKRNIIFNICFMLFLSILLLFLFLSSWNWVLLKFIIIFVLYTQNILLAIETVGYFKLFLTLKKYIKENKL